MRFIVTLIMWIPIGLFAQTGPGGVGDNSSNVFWLDANEITGYSDGDDLDTWRDVSGNGLDLTQPDASLTPEYRSSVLNGYPVVRFNKTSGTYGRLRRTGLSTFPSSGITQFIVNANVGEADDALTSYASAGGNNDFLIFNSANIVIYRGPAASTGVAANDGDWHIINPSWRGSDGDTRLWIDGEQQYSTIHQAGTSITSSGCFAIAGEQDAIDANYAANQAHLGDFAEVLVYNFRLNKAQRIIVNNYLAAKYMIAMGANDYYSYEATHAIDVAGIGRETLAEQHTAAMSDNILEVSNPTDLDNDLEYLLFGHDNGDVSNAWTTTETPDGGAYVQRLAREWRFSEINGDVGKVDLMVDVAGLPALPSGYSSYGLMVDSDGDFSTGALVYELGHTTGASYDLSAINIADGEFLAICAIDPKVNFSLASSEGFEPFDAVLEISIPYIPRANVTVEYSTSDGTALAAQPDYTTVTSALATISAGSTSTLITIAINDDAILESDESFIISLANPSAGVQVGATGVHTYTIHDDDHARKVYYTVASSSGDEGLSTVTLNVDMSSSSATDVSVDYLVSGGSATPGSDFVLAAGTLTISGGLGLSSGSFSFTVVDDMVYEGNETLVISLSNPQGANLDLPAPGNLGTGFIDQTYTIIDNDTPPMIQFGSTGTTVSEAIGTTVIAVELDVMSEIAATVSYTVTDGTAVSGSDYILSNGVLSIPAGSNSANILASIVDNSAEELPETFTINLTAASHATLGADVLFIQTIADNDLMGYLGPGGVGDKKSNKLWVSADYGVYNNAGYTEAIDGQRVQQWSDRSGNDFDLSQPSVLYRPIYSDNFINGLPSMRFYVNNNRLRRTDFNGFPRTEITSVTVMNTAQGNDGQLSYASAGDNNNYLLFNSANQATYIAGASTSSGYSHADGRWHIRGHIWKSRDGENRLYEDGTQIYSGTLATGRAITPGGCLAIGAEQDAVDGGYDVNQDFDGDIAETIIYNRKLNDAQRIIVDNYLAAKYGLTIRNDFYEHELTYGHEVAGIARVDSDNFHSDAQGTAIVRIHNPRHLDDGEYMLWGHDDGLQQAAEYSDVPTGIQARFSRVWRVSELDRTSAPADVGSVDVNWDLSGLGDVTITDLHLLVDTDNDGDFSDETPIGGAIDMGNNIYQFASVTALANNLRFTLATVDISQTPLPIELLSFDAESTPQQQIKLNWETATEIDNDYFTVERSKTGDAWEELVRVEGAGHSSAILAYETWDYAPFDGVSYYRLKQTDYDGRYTYSELRAVRLDQQEKTELRLYPNPAENQITLLASASEREYVQIFNMLGQDVTAYSQVVFDGDVKTIMDISSLEPGMYYVSTRSQSLLLQKR